MATLKSRWMVASKTVAGGYEIIGKDSGERWGYIGFFSRIWLFETADDILLNSECLADLARFLAELNKEK